MAYRRARPKRSLSRTERLDNLRGAVPAKDGPTMGDLILQRCKTQPDVDRVVSWLAKLMYPERPEAASVCCDFDAARRLWEWEKADGNVDLDALEEQHRCYP